ncbi:peptidoglycan DD-metalloendopeptidase family protein [Pedobacter sp.]|uniref:peptidoglycan DD-metalloendopeptidase family protein n=1 Tax=Pedobacter sp. TaxID=1411316 RepID=UPI003D7FF883
MSPSTAFNTYLKLNGHRISKVVDFNTVTDKLYPFDFTSKNTSLTANILADTTSFSKWVNQELSENDCKYGIGGYNEHRTIYARSVHFDTAEEPRRLHLGVDIWGKAATPVYNFHDATVHSFQFNDHYGDYGATIILKYNFDGLIVHALYGHLDLESLSGLQMGQSIAAGTLFARFGAAEENGHWPPHLHFQLIFDMKGLYGDYPGVCRLSESEQYLANSPDPASILQFTFPSSFD